MSDPWETGETYYGYRSAWVDTISRIDAAKCMSPERLRACLAWPDTQKTVRKFIERRLRKLEKSEEP
ncbi:MAG: hypothetical protein WC130_11130 [Kiritimatiellia bacterium]